MSTLVRLAAATGAPALVLTMGLAAPASAHGDGDLSARQATQVQRNAAVGAPLPSLHSDNVTPVTTVPGSAGISGCFMPTAPIYVVSNLDSVKIYDVRDPRDPSLLGALPTAQFENEAMSCGERKTRTGVKRFVLIGVDLVQASPDDIQHTNVGGGELVVVDVTNPGSPRIRSRAPGTTSTHTLTCVRRTDCRYAYSAGGRRSFSIFDLNDLNAPKELDANRTKAGVQPFSSPTGGHKWNLDAAGYATHTGWNGSSMWDVSRPARPRLVTTTGAAGRGEDPRYPGWNDFIHHNSFRPNARAFRPGARPSLANGNVLLVTEEDYEETNCSKAGSFQTWWVRRLDGTRGAITPLDKVELSDLGTFPAPEGAFCSSHWFDFHPSGIVAAGFYGGGTQMLDVRRPRDIRSYGYALSGASEVWDSMWAPVYTKDGVMTSRRHPIAYSIDLARGLDVYRVALPGSTGAARTGTGPTTTLASLAPSVPAGLLLLTVFAAYGLRRRAAGRSLA